MNPMIIASTLGKPIVKLDPTTLGTMTPYTDTWNWCVEQFGNASFHRRAPSPTRNAHIYYFQKEADRILFLLRWS